MALHRHGGRQLLDSYSEERLPIITDVIETTDRLTKVMGTPNVVAQFLRDSLIPTISQFSTVQHAFVNRLSGLGIAYSESPIVEGRGGRIFEHFMRGGQIPAAHCVLLMPEKASTNLRNSVESVAADFSTVVTIRTTPKNVIQLIRPDGYLAFSTEKDPEERAVASVRSLLMRMTDLGNEVAKA